MNVNDTMPSTFEEYAARLDLAADSPHREQAYRLWSQEREAERTYPATIPACPWWCDKEPGHEYDSYSPDGRGGIVHSRYHVREIGESAVRVDAFENVEQGVPAVGPVSILVSERLEDVSAERTRVLAYDLLAAADLLDRIAQ